MPAYHPTYTILPPTPAYAPAYYIPQPPLTAHDYAPEPPRYSYDYVPTTPLTDHRGYDPAADYAPVPQWYPTATPYQPPGRRAHLAKALPKARPPVACKGHGETRPTAMR